MPNRVPMDGMTDCIAVLPAADTSITMNNSAMRSFGKRIPAPFIDPFIDPFMVLFLAFPAILSTLGSSGRGSAVDVCLQ
jgi:hypothetical protein